MKLDTLALTAFFAFLVGLATLGLACGRMWLTGRLLP